jgi:Zn finger protein HypA/HybF involved in hydrogenase expression
VLEKYSLKLKYSLVFFIFVKLFIKFKKRNYFKNENINELLEILFNIKKLCFLNPSKIKKAFKIIKKNIFLKKQNIFKIILKKHGVQIVKI